MRVRAAGHLLPGQHFPGQLKTRVRWAAHQEDRKEGLVAREIGGGGGAVFLGGKSQLIQHRQPAGHAHPPFRVQAGEGEPLALVHAARVKPVDQQQRTSGEVPLLHLAVAAAGLQHHGVGKHDGQRAGAHRAHQVLGGHGAVDRAKDLGVGPCADHRAGAGPPAKRRRMASPATRPPPKLDSATWQASVGKAGLTTLSGCCLWQANSRVRPRTRAVSSVLHSGAGGVRAGAAGRATGRGGGAWRREVRARAAGAAFLKVAAGPYFRGLRAALMLNYYRVLGLGTAATAPQIDQAYLRQRARLKRLAAADPAMKARLADLEAGYGILANPRRRWAYDALLTRQPAAAGPAPGHGAAGPAAGYVRWARRLNAALLAGCLLLALDWALPLRRYPHETVRSRFPVAVSSSLSDPQLAYRVHTEHTTFRLPSAIGHRVREAEAISVWQTPLLGVVQRVSVPASPDGPAPFRPYGGTIYGVFALLPLLLAAVAAVGCLPGRLPETYVNTASVSGLLALLTLGALLWF